MKKLIFILLPIVVLAQVYVLKKDVLSAGGRKVTNSSANYVLYGTVSQTAIGKVEDTNYRGWIGFWSPPEAIPPSSPYIYVTKSDSNATLTWNKVTTDTMGNSEIIRHYVVYRNTSPSFIPGPSDSIGATVQSETTYTDVGTLNVGQSYYYLVKAVDIALNRSKKSNMGYKFNKVFVENPSATDKNWTSLPWHSEYTTVSDLTTDLSPSGDPLTKVTNLRDDQLYESYTWTTVPFPHWAGTDFTITSGRGYEMVTITDTSLVIVGSNNPDGLINLNENPSTTDKNWVSIPYNAIYSTVSDITTEYSPSGDPLTKVTNLRDDQLYESYTWTTVPFPHWAGTDFSITPGRAYEMVTINDTTWNPTEYSNETFAIALVHRPKSMEMRLHLGNLTEPDRAPAWSVNRPDNGLGTKFNKEIDYSNAEHYQLSAITPGYKADYREVGVSHLVRGYFKLSGCSNIAFTAYRPDSPYDVITENLVGSGIELVNDFALFWFDVGNFKHPWKPDDEIVLIVEALRQGRGYFAVLDVKLNAQTDIQELGEIRLSPIPEPSTKSSLSATTWDEINNDAVIGYSLFNKNRRLNDQIIAENKFSAEGELVLRPVIKGGYETVYSSQEVQAVADNYAPIYYSFGIHPSIFNDNIEFSYAIPQKMTFEISVYDISGRKIKTLYSGTGEPGYYKLSWNGLDDVGRTAAAGVYFVRFDSEEYKSCHKIVFVH